MSNRFVQVLTKQPSPNFCNTRTLLHFANIYVVHSGLDECEHVVQHGVVCGGKNVMYLKQLVKGTKWGGRPATDDIFVKYDKELVDFFLLSS